MAFLLALLIAVSLSQILLLALDFIMDTTCFGFDFFALLLIARVGECDSWFVLSPGQRLGSIIP